MQCILSHSQMQARLKNMINYFVKQTPIEKKKSYDIHMQI